MEKHLTVETFFVYTVRQTASDVFGATFRILLEKNIRFAAMRAVFGKLLSLRFAKTGSLRTENVLRAGFSHIIGGKARRTRRVKLGKMPKRRYRRIRNKNGLANIVGKPSGDARWKTASGRSFLKIFCNRTRSRKAHMEFEDGALLGEKQTRAVKTRR